MTPEQLECLREVFNWASGLPPDEADRAVRRAFSHDDSLYEEARRMLEAHWRSGTPDRSPAAAASSPWLETGQVVAHRYRIVRYLGRGGMGAVYEARDNELGVAVALKTLLPAIAEDQAMIARFKREIALSRKVAHPNVCKVFDIARHDADDGRQTVFLTMELLAGETLSAKLDRDGPMPATEALALLEQMAAALDASHAAGVIHRDFKPANVMLVSSSGGVRSVVMDFGLARSFAAAGDNTTTLTANVMGTPAYMAPELLMGAPATCASDVYAFGVTAYQMVTGALPSSVPAAIARAPGDISPRISKQLPDTRWKEAIRRALGSEPAGRFQSAAHFVRSLRGQNVSASVTLPFRLSPRTLRWIAGLAAVVAVTAIALWIARARTVDHLPREAQMLYRNGVASIDAGAYFAADKALEEAVKLAPRAPQVRARLAEALLELDTPERAAKEMLQARRENSASLSKADSLRIEAIDLAITHDYAAAAAKYAQIAHENDSAEIEVDLGRADNNAGKPDDAITAFRRAAEGPEHSPAAWLRLGVLYGVQRKKKLSDDAFAEADRLYQLISNLEGLGETALQRGIAATARSEFDSGAKYLASALDIAQHAGNWQQDITATLRLSSNAYLVGDTAAAERYAGDGLELARTHNLNTLAVRGLVSLGNASRLRRGYQDAERRYRQALDLAVDIQERHLVAYSRLSLAGLYWDMGRREEAAAEARQALSFYRPDHYAKEALQAETVIARFERDTGDYDAALASLRSLLNSAESLHDTQSIAAAQGDLGTVLFNLDRLPEALDHYRLSAGLAADAQQAGYAEMQCGNTLWQLGQYEEANRMFDKADTAALKFPQLSMRILYSRAGMLLSQNKYEAAADKARTAMAADITHAPEFEADVDEVLGLALVRSGNIHPGLARCERAWNAFSTGSDVSERLPAAAALVEARMAAGKRDEARAVFRQIESDLGKSPETRWRVFALLASFDPAYTEPARAALAQLARDWGESMYNTYLMRPDMSKLSRQVLPSISKLQ